MCKPTAPHVYDRTITYQRFIKPGIVEDSRYRVMEVIQINLAGGLEFVEVIEETERKSGARVVPGGREPSGTEQLDAWWNHRTIRFTFTVRNLDRMDAGNVEHSERSWGGGDSAGAAVDVAEVEDRTKVS